MGLTKIDGFTGEAELRGCLYRVQYGDGRLTVFDVRLEDAYDMLDALKAGQVTAVRVRGDAVRPTEEPRRDKTPAEAKAAAEPTREEKPAPVKEAPPPAKTETDPAVQPEVLPAEGAGATGIPEKIQKSGRFIEVMEWVMKERGLLPVQVEAIVLAMEALKPHVKVVSRVPNLKSKVEANLAAFAESGGA